MIRIIGTIVLLPVALVGLLVGFVAFGAKLLEALAEDGISRLAHTG